MEADFHSHKSLRQKQNIGIRGLTDPGNGKLSRSAPLAAEKVPCVEILSLVSLINYEVTRVTLGVADPGNGN